MKRLFWVSLVALAATVLNLSGCGNTPIYSGGLLVGSSILKCDQTVTINQDGTVAWQGAGFQKACVVPSTGPDAGVVQPWDRLVQSISNPTCGFWVTKDDELVTYDNFELDLNDPALETYAPCN